jgi:hypothetical protein
MRDEEAGQPKPLLQILKQVDDLGLYRDVKRGNRLIGNDKLRVERKRSRNSDSLTLPPAELMRIAAGMIRLEPDQSQQFYHSLGPSTVTDITISRTMYLKRFSNYLSNSHSWIERGVWILKNYLHPLPNLAQPAPVECTQINAVKLDLAARRLDQPQQATATGRLATPGLTNQSQRLAAVDLQRDTVDRTHLLIVFTQIPDFDKCSGHPCLNLFWLSVTCSNQPHSRPRLE